MGKIIVKFEFPKMTQKHYDQIINEMKSAGTIKQKRRLSHFAGPTKNGWFVLDVWESEQAFKDFGTTLMPIMQKLEIPKADPEIFPMYNEIH